MPGVVRVELIGHELLLNDREIRLESGHSVEIEHRQAVVLSRASDRLDIRLQFGIRGGAGTVLASAVERCHDDDDFSGVLLDETGAEYIQSAAEAVGRPVVEFSEGCVAVTEVIRSAENDDDII